MSRWLHLNFQNGNYKYLKSKFDKECKLGRKLFIYAFWLSMRCSAFSSGRYPGKIIIATKINKNRREMLRYEQKRFHLLKDLFGDSGK